LGSNPIKNSNPAKSFSNYFFEIRFFNSYFFISQFLPRRSGTCLLPIPSHTTTKRKAGSHTLPNEQFHSQKPNNKYDATFVCEFSRWFTFDRVTRISAIEEFKKVCFFIFGLLSFEFGDVTFIFFFWLVASRFFMASGLVIL
jgi:hypothetical protein